MSNPADIAAAQMLTSLLRDVSRSFYLTLRVLPRAVRRQIGIAYLLARATDTIADTDVVPLAARLHTLVALKARILGQTHPPLDLGKLADQQGSAAERALLKRIEEALHLLDTLAEPDRELVREVLATITSGQELDLQRFARATPAEPIALQVDEELDDYTYRVAGCVGEFWTKICLAHLHPPAHIDREKLIANGIRFGKGLQLVNILRDLSADLLKGRCYLPHHELKKLSLSPRDLLDPNNYEPLRPLYNAYLTRADAHLAAGWTYTNTLPYTWPRLRLACAWPILIGLRTTALLRTANPLDGSRRIKITRPQVKRLIASSILSYPFPPLWNRLPNATPKSLDTVRQMPNGRRSGD